MPGLSYSDTSGTSRKVEQTHHVAQVECTSPYSFACLHLAMHHWHLGQHRAYIALAAPLYRREELVPLRGMYVWLTQSTPRICHTHHGTAL